jgi:tetratricopeptide (TPR) repeat protein
VLAALLIGGLALVRAAGAQHPAEPLAAGEAAYARGDLAGARAAWLSALHGRPRDSGALWRLARVEAELARTAEGEYERRLTAAAVEHAGAAIRVAPDSALGHLALAEALQVQSRREGPRTRLALARQIKAEADRAIALAPRLARAYHVRGIWNRAQATRGWWDRLMGRTVRGGAPRGASLENAVQDFQRAIELEPRDVSHHLELGRTLAKLDRKAEARRALETAMTLPPTSSPFDGAWHAEARELLARLE